LLDFKEEVTLIRKDVAKKARMKRDQVQKEADVHKEYTGQQRTKKQKREVDTFFDVQQADEMNNENIPIDEDTENGDEVSIATGAGRNALLSLLSMAERSHKSDLFEDESVSSDDVGKHALQSLLQQSTVASNNDNSKSRTKVNKSKTIDMRQREDTSDGKEDDDDISSNVTTAKVMSSEEEFSVATNNPGKNALASLLSLV
jgi:hypothetical protein